MISDWTRLRIASSQLPIGGYSYSQGLEWLIESGKISDGKTAVDWLKDQLLFNLGRFEGVLLFHLCKAIQLHDWKSAQNFANQLKASRETAELFLESRQMGYSLMALINETEQIPSELQSFITQQQEIHFSLAWAVTTCLWQINPEDAIKTWLWTWLENQISVIIKTLPLGQIAAQRLINQLLPYLNQTFQQIKSADLQKIGTLSFGFALNSINHEHQYSRLFRS